MIFTDDYAEELGITIALSLLGLADEVIEQGCLLQRMSLVMAYCEVPTALS